MGQHWLGVMYQNGVGVSKNIEKAIENLEAASKKGNCMSSYQLYLIYGFEDGHKDIKKAYKYLEKGCQYGVTGFDDFTKLFKDNYDILCADFIARK